MPQSLARVVLHITFSTKHRKPFLRSAELRGALDGYVVGTLKNLKCPSIITRSVEDHIHILCNLARTITIAKLLEEVKSSSSEWLKRDEQGVEDFYWQNGYGAFSVGESGVGGLQQYIANQEEHHRKVTFQEEFRSLLERHNIPYDERYVWD
jgi:putative transposase